MDNRCKSQHNLAQQRSYLVVDWSVMSAIKTQQQKQFLESDECNQSKIRAATLMGPAVAANTAVDFGDDFFGDEWR